MNINELEKTAKEVSGWSSCNKSWLDTSEDEPIAVVGYIDEGGETYPVVTVDCDLYYAGGDSIKLAKFYAEANPPAILELICAYREAVAAFEDIYSSRASKHGTHAMMTARCMNIARIALDTAKRLGVE